MSLLNDARALWLEKSSDTSQFGVEMAFTAPTGETANVIGLHTKHHQSFDLEGRSVNSKNAHISVSEKLFTDAGYPVRNSSGEVHMKGHLVVCKDSTGSDKNYIVREWYQNETLGVIVMILGDYGG
jgi:hypothetical protein